MKRPVLAEIDRYASILDQDDICTDSFRGVRCRCDRRQSFCGVNYWKAKRLDAGCLGDSNLEVIPNEKYRYSRLAGTTLQRFSQIQASTSDKEAHPTCAQYHVTGFQSSLRLPSAFDLHEDPFIWRC